MPKSRMPRKPKKQRLKIAVSSLFESRVAAALGISQAGPGQCSSEQSSVELRSDVYLAAVSGGADSTAMLAALAELRRNVILRNNIPRNAISHKAGFTLHCIHVEHGIRPDCESKGDARAVQALCEELQVNYHLVSIPQGRISAFARSRGTGIEAAARIFRRRAWTLQARRIGAKYVLTAHTQDDLLETLLMRILRGSGPAGLAAMPQSRGCLLRPLLDIRRQDVLAYLEERGIPYRTDSTNADIRFLRNRIRHKLVPLLDEFFPSWRSSLMALAETQSLTAQFLASEAGKRLPWEKIFGQEPDAGMLLRLSEADFIKAPPILREEAVFEGADMLAGKGKRCFSVPRRAAVRRAAEQGAAAAEDLGPVRIQRERGFIEMLPVARLGSKGRGPGDRGFSMLIKEAGVYTLKGSPLLMGKLALHIRAGLDYTKNLSHGVFSASFPLVLKNHREGDCLYKGGHKRRFSDIIDSETRAGYTGIITACDADGPAAFVCFKRSGELLVLSREDVSLSGSSLFEVFGGINA